MPFEIFIEKRALKQLGSILKKDRESVKEVLLKLDSFPTGLDVKKLVGSRNKYRIRMGKWRILVDIEPGRIIVFDILPRKKAYR